LALQEVGRIDLSLSWTLFVAPVGAYQILALGTDEQKEQWIERWVIPVARGEAVTSGAITEPDAGSDTRNIKTTARLDGDEWVINGSKAFITNAGLDINAFVSVLCRGEGRGGGGFDTILVPKGAPGYSIMPAYKKMGLRSCDTRELVFEDCRVPALNRIGSAGKGRGGIVRGFFAARIMLASTALGLAEECLALAREHACQRRAFKRPIAAHQHVQGMLSEMAMNVELSRLIRDKSARLFMEGREHAKEAAMAKWFCCETAKRAADNAVQIFGGMGFMDECAVSRYYRDIRAATIADGTTEIQKHIIAREMGLPTH
jgi:butyryl-CoA dehydrogenase